MLSIYHNPRCKKSREALQLIKDQGKEAEIIEYLKNPPSKSELSEIISLLGISAEDLLRKNETLFKENFKGKKLDDDGWIEIMIKNPKLIERPIVITSKGARIGRPPEKILEIL